MPRKPNMAQTEIPVGNEIGRKHEPDDEKWGTRNKHKPPCPRAGKRF